MVTDVRRQKINPDKNSTSGISNMEKDTEVFDLIRKELERQRNGIELIASENFTSLQGTKQSLDFEVEQL